jgi:hypothetical protein
MGLSRAFTASFAQGDVNGDGVPDNIYLTGLKNADSPFIQNITLFEQEGKTGRLIRVELSENAGYNPRVNLFEFTGDHVLDVMVSIDSGGSGGIMYHYIYSFINNTPRQIFDFNAYNNEYHYKINYLDNYRVEALCENNGRKYIIDISSRETEYLNEIYDKDGKLKGPVEGFVNPLSGLYPVDFDSNGVFELLAYQKIAGRYNADSLGYFLNTLKWNGRDFSLDNQYVAIF